MWWYAIVQCTLLAMRMLGGRHVDTRRFKHDLFLKDHEGIKNIFPIPYAIKELSKNNPTKLLDAQSGTG